MNMRKKQYHDRFYAPGLGYYMERQSVPQPRYARFLRMLA